MKLNLGCGRIPKEGFVNVDSVARPGVDVVHDLEQTPWPFEDNSCEEVFTSHCIEHIHNFAGFMNEIHRVLAPGAKAEIHAPHYMSMRAWQDPTHVRPISEGLFLYTQRAWRESNGIDYAGFTCDFSLVEYGVIYEPEIEQVRSKDWLTFASKHYWNVCRDIVVWLTKPAA